MDPSVRILSTALLRASRSNVLWTRPSKCLKSQWIQSTASPLSKAPCVQIRWQSRDSATRNGSSKDYAFEDIKNLISKPSPDRILIDTREPSELADTGHIPTAINIPITSQPDSFFISEEDFEDRFGFERPSKEAEVVFYCKAGVRSRAAAQLARQGGWERTGEYAGSWLDWAGKGGQVERK